jgi:hypothetical protein
VGRYDFACKRSKIENIASVSLKLLLLFYLLLSYCSTSNILCYAYDSPNCFLLWCIRSYMHPLPFFDIVLFLTSIKLLRSSPCIASHQYSPRIILLHLHIHLYVYQHNLHPHHLHPHHHPHPHSLSTSSSSSSLFDMAGTAIYHRTNRNKSSKSPGRES